jgi:hypothetical protein
VEEEEEEAEEEARGERGRLQRLKSRMQAVFRGRRGGGSSYPLTVMTSSSISFNTPRFVKAPVIVDDRLHNQEKWELMQCVSNSLRAYFEQPQNKGG